MKITKDFLKSLIKEQIDNTQLKYFIVGDENDSSSAQIFSSFDKAQEYRDSLEEKGVYDIMVVTVNQEQLGNLAIGIKYPRYKEE